MRAVPVRSGTGLPCGRAYVTSGVDQLSTVLTLDDLAIGFDELFGDDAKDCNPFRGETTRVLNLPGEPLFDFIGVKGKSPKQKP